MYRFVILGLAAFLVSLSDGQRPALAQQDAPPLDQPALGSPLSPEGAGPMQVTAADAPIKPLTEGPLHEAFLSPVRDRDPDYVAKAPPPPIVERPGVDAPSPNAQWIEGYWDWDPKRNDFLWVTGTWRVPPPGKFWVNGYWKRDDKGWYRVPGFWSDRKTDRIDFRKSGPPADHPPDEPGESPGKDYFYVPGHYAPDGDGVVWKPGFWARIQPGWAWVPAQWVRQPEGWAYQEGYWDRVLEDRGTLFAPAEVTDAARNPNTVYQPYTQISPQSYGLLYGAFGRPNPYYDGYPGCYYDPYGRYYGYAQYGTMSPYYGYLDYPYYGSFGYPYVTTGLGYYGGYGFPGYYGAGFGGLGPGYAGYGGFGLGFFGGGLYNRFGLGFGFGNSLLPYAGLGGGFGLGYGGYGLGFGYPWGGFGLGYGGFGGFGLGFGGFGFGGFGLGFGGLGFGGFGFPVIVNVNRFGGFNNRGFHNNFPFHPGAGNRWANGRGTANASHGVLNGSQIANHQGNSTGVLNQRGLHNASMNSMARAIITAWRPRPLRMPSRALSTLPGCRRRIEERARPGRTGITASTAAIKPP